MKIGMIFECGPMGADKKVCEILARRLNPNLEITSITLDNKPNLTTECGKVTARLLRDGCEKVLIIWDLHPAWRNSDYPPCRKEDRETIFASLDKSNVSREQVKLICIAEELEAWLIADERAVSQYLSSPTRPVRFRRVKKPEQKSNPKAFLNEQFQQLRGKQYNDLIHAEKIVKALPDFTRLRKCASFARFESCMQADQTQ